MGYGDPTKGLRFCPIQRVSTPGQAEKGVSLEVQKEVNISAVESLDGTIPDYCWQYSGQEHATPDNERKLYSKHLDDCDKDLFDAVMFDDKSRFNRNPVTNDLAIKTYLKNGIRFFIGRMEYDLDDPDHVFQLDQDAAFNKRMAAHLRKITVRGKLKKAQMAAKGECKVPASKKRQPFGREHVYDKKSGKWIWKLDKNQAKLIQDTAIKILNKGSLKAFAHELTINHGMPFKSPEYLRKVLIKRSGDKWVFMGVEFTIPHILEDEIIEAVREQFKKNQKCNRTDVKKYPMSGYAYHKQCGKCLGFLTDTRTGKRKVKHPSGRFVSCRPQFERDADLLEKTVDNMLRKFTLDKAGFQKAVNERYAELEDVKALDKAIASADKDLKKINQSLYNLALAVEEGTLRKESLQRRETELYEQKSWIESHRKKLTYKQKRADEIVQLKKDALKWRKEHYKYFKSPERFQQMSYDEKVNFYNYFFNGKDENGVPFGIYVEINSNGDMKVELYGRYIVGPNNYEVIKRRPAIYTFRARKTINDKVDDFSLIRTKHIIDKHITYAFNRGQTRR